MECGSFDRYLEPPPRLVAAAEALPHVGGLALAAYQGDLPDEIELHAATALDDAFSDATAQEMMKRAFAMPKVRDRLAQGRVMTIGISRRGDPAKDERRSYLIVAYDYTTNMAIEIHLDDQGELLGINDERYQPPPIQSEIDRAISLARLDERLAAKVAGLTGMAIPYAGASNEFENQRVLEVLFGCRTERLPQYRAFVDLGTESVLHAGQTCGCCNKAGEVQS
jgi:hypothetical protein